MYAEKAYQSFRAKRLEAQLRATVIHAIAMADQEALALGIPGFHERCKIASTLFKSVKADPPLPETIKTLEVVFSKPGYSYIGDSYRPKLEAVAKIAMRTITEEVEMTTGMRPTVKLLVSQEYSGHRFSMPRSTPQNGVPENWKEIDPTSYVQGDLLPPRRRRSSKSELQPSAQREGFLYANVAFDNLIDLSQNGLSQAKFKSLSVCRWCKYDTAIIAVHFGSIMDRVDVSDFSPKFHMDSPDNPIPPDHIYLINYDARVVTRMDKFTKKHLNNFS